MMRTGLVLMGGGARAAYQVGALEGIREILDHEGWPAARNPFAIVCGTSAGGINATALAARSDDWHEAIECLVATWSGLHAGRVYRVDLPGSLANAARWVSSLTLGWLLRSRPRSLFDNGPLAQLLDEMIDLERLQHCLETGVLDALAITASSYTSGQHVTYFQSGQPRPPWFRNQRLSSATRITPAHLLASSAIPFIFPAVALSLGDRQEYFGDGSMRQTSPISPAIHLGAERILVIGAGQLETGSASAGHAPAQFQYPSLAQIAGHALSSIFLDGLASDIERLHRINHTVSLVEGGHRHALGLRQIRLLAITPSQRLDKVAIPHLRSLPRTSRTLLRVLGATESRGAVLGSYLLFEAAYTRELIALGRADTLRRSDQVKAFFGDGPSGA